MHDQLVAETATYTTQNKPKRRTSLPSAGFETRDPSIQAAADLRLTAQATGIGKLVLTFRLFDQNSV
jgi:hypothetical protein